MNEYKNEYTVFWTGKDFSYGIFCPRIYNCKSWLNAEFLSEATVKGDASFSLYVHP